LRFVQHSPDLVNCCFSAKQALLIKEKQQKLVGSE